MKKGLFVPNLKAKNINEPLLKKNPTHRYLCEACTGVAFYHIESEPLPEMVICACGASRRFKIENLIKICV